MLRPPPSGGAGYPEAKKTERSEGPESFRYIARHKQPFKLFESEARVARSMPTRAMTQGRRKAPAGGFPVIIRDAVLLRFVDTFFTAALTCYRDLSDVSARRSESFPIQQTRSYPAHWRLF